MTESVSVEPAYKVGCRVNGAIGMFFVRKVDSWQHAIDAVKEHAKNVNPVLALVSVNLKPTLPPVEKELA